MNKKTIEKMTYTEFIALLQETNRCPGGKKTICRVNQVLSINSSTKILEIGSNTGFTSLEFARISPAKIYGIDISKECVSVAKELCKKDILNIKKRVNFKVGSSYSVPFKDQNFDIIMAGGATGFMDNKSQAMKEYFRVLKNWGFFIMTPLVYHTEPPNEILESINKILGTSIKPMKAIDWQKKVLTENPLWELYFEEFKTLSPRSDEDIKNYVSYFMNKEHIAKLDLDIKDVIRNRWENSIKVFNQKEFLDALHRTC